MSRTNNVNGKNVKHTPSITENNYTSLCSASSRGCQHDTARICC